MSAESAIKLLRLEYEAAVSGQRIITKDSVRRVLWNADVDDGLRRAIEDLSNWYLEKDACSAGSVTATLDIANDLQSLLHDPDTFQRGVNDDNE